MRRVIYDCELSLQPPCPDCSKPLFPRLGINDERIYWCPTCGCWELVPLEREGEQLPLLLWTPYNWKTL